MSFALINHVTQKVFVVVERTLQWQSYIVASFSQEHLPGLALRDCLQNKDSRAPRSEDIGDVEIFDNMTKVLSTEATYLATISVKMANLFHENAVD